MPSSCNKLYRAIVIQNVETGEDQQVTDGLADATSPAWDASGKYSGSSRRPISACGRSGST